MEQQALEDPEPRRTLRGQRPLKLLDPCTLECGEIIPQILK